MENFSFISVLIIMFISMLQNQIRCTNGASITYDLVQTATPASAGVAASRPGTPTGKCNNGVKSQCSAPSCVDWVLRPRSCCPICLYGPNCWGRLSGNLIRIFAYDKAVKVGDKICRCKKIDFDKKWDFKDDYLRYKAEYRAECDAITTPAPTTTPVATTCPFPLEPELKLGEHAVLTVNENGCMVFEVLCVPAKCPPQPVCKNDEVTIVKNPLSCCKFIECRKLVG